jgi:iron complex transport system substrate-binding protein
MGSATIDDVYVAGHAGFYDEMITLAGGTNAYRGELAFPVVTREGLLRLKPEIILDMVADLPESGLTETDVLQQWNTLPDLPAVRRGRVFLFTDDFVVVPGPRFIQILEKMAAVIHPEGIES